MTTVVLTGSMLGYYRAQYNNLAAYGLTAKEAERMLSEIMKRRGVKWSCL